MYIYKQDDEVPWEDCVATMGFFDGVHLGHRHLINELSMLAYETNKNAVVVTFDMHPRKVLNRDVNVNLLCTTTEKLALLETTGVAACVLLRFTPELAQFSAKTFMKEILYEKLHIGTLLVGHDHRFGKDRIEGLDDYVRIGKTFGMSVIEATKYKDETYSHTNSSAIRSFLQEGNLTAANHLLSYPYSLSGTVVGGYKMGRKLGYPTANIQLSDRHKLIPVHGVYAVTVFLDKKVYRGMLNIGFRPTFTDEKKTTIEVHILDFDKDIYSFKIKIALHYRLRENRKFVNTLALIAQLKEDEKHTRQLLGD